MDELISSAHLQKIERLLKQWNDACRAALEHNTPENNHAADVLAGVLAGYVRPLVNTLQEIRRRSDVGELFDGHDELNEDTHEGNEKLLTGALDRVNEMARGVFED
jgi:hypothetical protein